MYNAVYLHNAKVTVLHFHAVNMTKLNNVPTNKLGPCLIYLLTTNLTASSILMSILHTPVRRTCAIKRLHYHACTPHMHVAFSMFETAHTYDVHVCDKCMYTGVVLGRQSPSSEQRQLPIWPPLISW